MSPWLNRVIEIRIAQTDFSCCITTPVQSGYMSKRLSLRVFASSLFGSLLFASLLHPLMLRAETITLTMKQAVNRALQESPDIALARIDEQKATMNVSVVKDPFSPKIGVGSGI